MLANLTVILVQPRFPENIGMAARACANMGCPGLRVVCPERWNMTKAAKLATSQGQAILEAMTFHPDLAEALTGCHAAWGASARRRGGRQPYAPPWHAAAEISGQTRSGERCALVFGPEDRGLSNSELAMLNGVVQIPAKVGATSLNLAQAVLILLYECRKAAMEQPQAIAQPAGATLDELALLETSLRKALTSLDCLHGKESDHYFGVWHRMLLKMRPSRREFDLLMGLCRQIGNKIEPGEK